MSYDSIEKIQNALAADLFSHAADQRKAAGRALGTIVEILTYYILREWGLAPYLSIEQALPEFGSGYVKHNVEFALHPRCEEVVVQVTIDQLPVTPSKLRKLSPVFAELVTRHELTLTTNQLYHNLGGAPAVRNASILARGGGDGPLLVGNLMSVHGNEVTVDMGLVRAHPYAMIECKRVGVEEGKSGPLKGPTTIEKAKQGAYVARHVSALQKVRRDDGRWYGSSRSRARNQSYLACTATHSTASLKAMSPPTVRG